MKERTPYSYSVLRYVHDVASGEFVNLGVVVFSPQNRYFHAAMRKTIARITKFFPDAKGRALMRTLRALESSLNRRGEDLREAKNLEMFSDEVEHVLDLARKHLPADDSSLQWSEVLGGLTVEPAKTLDHLFDRLVTRYDEKSLKDTRSDEQVWRKFSRALEVRNLSQCLQEHEVKASFDSVRFEHAVKNGKWHVLEPVSFDLTDGMSIKRKARQIVGEMTVLKDAIEDFDIYLLVGEPSSPAVRHEYEIAIKTLSMIQGTINAHIFTESEADIFAQRISKVMEDHPC